MGVRAVHVPRAARGMGPRRHVHAYTGSGVGSEAGVRSWAGSRSRTRAAPVPALDAELGTRAELRGAGRDRADPPPAPGASRRVTRSIRLTGRRAAARPRRPEQRRAQDRVGRRAFNNSEHCRTVAGVARSLGAPGVAVGHPIRITRGSCGSSSRGSSAGIATKSISTTTLRACASTARATSSPS